MEEDLEFNRFIKSALESEASIGLLRSAERRPSVLRWVVPALAAASLALTAILHTTFSSSADQVSDAIRLLAMVDELEVDGKTPTDLLLAWQDAPCAEFL